MSAKDSVPRLGVNIDHIATLRQLRGTPYPNLLEAAKICERAGADQITVHLREDRRHIQDQDVWDLRGMLKVSLNLEMAATDSMLKLATRISPDHACLVPEKRQEVTTEGGLDLARNEKRIGRTIEKLHQAGIQVSLFIEPSLQAVKLSKKLGADSVELHTGTYCNATQVSNPGTRGRKKVTLELERIRKAAKLGQSLGLHVHAGHGFDYENVRAVAVMPEIEEYNIGHSIVCRAALVGLDRAVREMVSAIRAP